MKKKSPGRALSSNPLDYPSNMSGYERDSLVAEAILAAERKMAKSAQECAAVGKGKARKIGQRLMTQHSLLK
jgi:hypothetical protein